MLLSPKKKRLIGKIIPFGVVWLVFGLIYVFLEKGFLGDFDYYPSTKNPYEFTSALIITPDSFIVYGRLLRINRSSELWLFTIAQA